MNQFENAHERVDVTLIRRLAADGTAIDLIAEQFYLSTDQVERILAGESLDDVETEGNRQSGSATGFVSDSGPSSH